MDFRRWCSEKWYEHCAECEAWYNRPPAYTSKEYFNKYRWWLKREYQYQQENNLL